jgi:murein DD-endopeptidase MepM/ murein hydrolase activator NlpD
MSRIVLGLGMMLALAGCAVSNTPYPRPDAPVPYARPTPRPNNYSSAPRAPVHSQLFACGSWGSNLGEIGYQGEFVQFEPYISTPAGPLLRLPVEAACLSSGFGWRGSLQGGRQHNGVDLANPEGGYVFAAADGWVRSAEVRGGYGNVVEIDHGNGVRTLYAHLGEIDPNLYSSSHVRAGAAIGRMGMTGNATGVHLHYEVYVDGMLVDPLHYGRPPVFVSAPAPEDAAAGGHAQE